MLASGLDLVVRKLAAHRSLSAEDREAMLALPFVRRNLPPTSYLVRKGQSPRFCCFLLSGFAFRHKIVGDGGRQIVSLHIPGEALDFQGLFLDCSDHNVQTLTATTLAQVPMAAIGQLMSERVAVARAMLTEVMVEGSISREWMARIGRRDARTRLAHLLCEFACRLDAQGLQDTTYEIPMTQEQFGEALGLTGIHVNRSIRLLESEGLIRRNKRTMRFPDIGRLRKVADFSTRYLHREMSDAID
jgi:CRP-like cAMP-binding protein